MELCDWPTDKYSALIGSPDVVERGDWPTDKYSALIGSPDGVERGDWPADAQALGVLLQHSLGVVVGDLGGLSHQRGVLQIFAGDLFVQGLQTVEEGAVAEPKDISQIIISVVDSERRLIS